MDFEVFPPDLEKALAYSDGSKGGRPPFDVELMFKILVIQTLNNLSDEHTEYLTNDRLSFMRFLDLGLSDRMPDAKTIWLFRERLTQAQAVQTVAQGPSCAPDTEVQRQEDGSMPATDIAIPFLATNPMPPSTGSSGSSGNGRRQMRPPVMVRD